MMQTSLDKFKFDALLDKQPLVIDDPNCNMDIIKDAWFQFNPSTMFTVTGSDIWHTNRYKYNLVKATSEREVLLCHPNIALNDDGVPNPDASVVAVQMSAGQVLIVPFHWHYCVPLAKDSACECMGINDLVTYFLP